VRGLARSGRWHRQLGRRAPCGGDSGQGAVGCGGPTARRRATAGFGGAASGIARTVRAAACSAVAPRTRRSTASSEAARSAAGEGMDADRGSAGTVSVVGAGRGSGPRRWDGSHFWVSEGDLNSKIINIIWAHAGA
jgi:hypothetical protein